MPKSQYHAIPNETDNPDDATNPDTAQLMGYLTAISLEEEAKSNLYADIKCSINQFDRCMKEIEALILCRYAHLQSQRRLHLDANTFGHIKEKILQAYQETSHILSWCYAAQSASEKNKKRTKILFSSKKRVAWQALKKIQKKQCNTPISGQIVRNEYNYLLHTWLTHKASHATVIAFTHFFHSSALFDLEELGFFYSDASSLHPHVGQLAERAMLIENILSLIRLFRSVARSVFSVKITQEYYKNNSWHAQIGFKKYHQKTIYTFPSGRNLSPESIMRIVEIKQYVRVEEDIREHLKTHPQIQERYAPNIMAICETLWAECINEFKGIFDTKEKMLKLGPTSSQHQNDKFGHRKLSRAHSASPSPQLKRLLPRSHGIQNKTEDTVYHSGVSDNMLISLQNKGPLINLKVGRLNLQWTGSARPVHRNQPSVSFERDLKKTTKTKENINKLLALQAYFLHCRKKYRRILRIGTLIGIIGGATGCAAALIPYCQSLLLPHQALQWPSHALHIIGAMAITLLCLSLLARVLMPLVGRYIQYLYIQSAKTICFKLVQRLQPQNANRLSLPRTPTVPLNTLPIQPLKPQNSAMLSHPLNAKGLPVIPDNVALSDFTDITLSLNHE